MLYIHPFFEGVEGCIAPMLQIKNVFINYFFDCIIVSVTEFTCLSYKTFFKTSVVMIKNRFFQFMLLFI